MDFCLKSPALPVGASVERAAAVNMGKKPKFTSTVQLFILLQNRLLLAVQTLISDMFMTRVLTLIFNSDILGSLLDVLLLLTGCLSFFLGMACNQMLAKVVLN